MKGQITKEQRMKTILCGIMAVALAFSTTIVTAQGAGAKNESSGSGLANGVPEITIVFPDISLVDLKQAIADKSVALLDCKADAPKCDKCGMAKGVPGCCIEAKAK